MKKIYLLLSFVAGLLFTSCDMDLSPVGSLDDESAIETPTDLMKARNGIYNNMRSFATGGYIYYTDIQMDQFIGLTINGNQNGILAGGTILSNNSSIESVWAGLYSNIADANYLLGRANALLEKGGWTEEELIDINRYIAETKFARAWYYSYLLDHFTSNDPADKDKPASGVPIVTVFNPTGDVASYPGRSTIAEVYAQIDQDLTDAYAGLSAYEKEDATNLQPMAMYLNTNVIKALQARLALLREDFATAVSKANELINSGIYTLATTTNYAQMWANDNSEELIFRPVSTNTELGISSIGGAYIDANPKMAYYIPSYTAYSYYNLATDQRFKAFFKAAQLTANGDDYGCYVFNKYPGNDALKQNANINLMNMGKPFRLSETYLILAEASYALGDEKTANEALDTIRKNRINRYNQTSSYTGLELRDEIRSERTKELIGEGFRMSDLRRWGLGFQRNGEYPIQPATEEIFKTVDVNVSYISGDHRYVWPIPTTEMENNPQLKGQQNPGY